MDTVACIITELLECTDKHRSEAGVYHLVNLRSVTWKALIPRVQAFLGVQIAPLAEWVHALRVSLQNSEDTDRNPAVKLLGFFKSLMPQKGLGSNATSILPTTQTVSSSKTLASIRPMNDESMENWM